MQAQIVNLLLELQDRLGLSYLFVAHDLSVVKHVSHRVAVMYVGRIVEVAPTATLFARAEASLHRGAAFGRARCPIRASAPSRIVLEGEVADPSRPPPGCAFHPRCRYAIERCRAEVPQLEPVTGGGLGRLPPGA